MFVWVEQRAFRYAVVIITLAAVLGFVNSLSDSSLSFLLIAQGLLLAAGGALLVVAWRRQRRIR